MAISDQEFEKVKDDLKKVTDILFGISDDPRFKAKVRKQIFDKEHTTDKPTIINSNGKVYKLEIV